MEFDNGGDPISGSAHVISQWRTSVRMARLGLGRLLILLFYPMPCYVWSDGKLAELAEQLGKQMPLSVQRRLTCKNIPCDHHNLGGHSRRDDLGCNSIHFKMSQKLSRKSSPKSNLKRRYVSTTDFLNFLLELVERFSWHFSWWFLWNF